MRRISSTGFCLLVALFAAAAPAWAQGAPHWRPSTTQMPVMPTMAELQNDWGRGLSAWFSGVEQVTGVPAQGLRASGTAGGSGGRVQVARFLRGPVPVVVMTDRNGDDRADMIEYYRSGVLVLQIIDADYNGQANSMRIYDAAGALIREERL
jgi:hypothetical protein